MYVGIPPVIGLFFADSEISTKNLHIFHSIFSPILALSWISLLMSILQQKWYYSKSHLVWWIIFRENIVSNACVSFLISNLAVIYHQGYIDHQGSHHLYLIHINLRGALIFAHQTLQLKGASFHSIGGNYYRGAKAPLLNWSARIKESV